MKLRRAPAGEGARWARESLAVFFRQPLGFAALLATCMLTALVVGVVPWLGSFVVGIAVPAVSLVFMIASCRVVSGASPFPGAIGDLLKGRDRWLELVKLGVVCLVSLLATMWLANALDGGAWTRFEDALARARGAADAEGILAGVDADAVRFGLFVRLTVAGLLSIPFWHAPGLVWWGRQPVLKSLFFSTVAVWRNGRAFLVFGLVWAAAWLAVALALGLLTAVAGPVAGFALAVPLTMIFWTVAFASIWFTFAGCFELEPADTGSRGAPAKAGSGGDPT